MILYLDTETRSATPINQGVHRYVRDPFFRLLMVSWAIDDEEEKLWEPIVGEPMPPRLKRALEDDSVTVVISNSGFDRVVLKASGFSLKTERIHDVMVMALAHGLPGGLGQLSEIFGLGVDAKDKRGKELIQIFCTPVRGKTPVRFHDRDSHPEDWQDFGVYAKSDIRAMRAAYKRLPKLNYPQLEHNLWILDQKISDRGLPVDVELAEAAVRESADEKKRLNDATREATFDEVEAATQRDKLLHFIAKEHDVWLPDLKKSTLERRLRDDELPVELRNLMELRLDSSKNAASKYKRVIQHQVDGRLHGTLQMYGAARTGRDAGRVFQPQNLMRPVCWKGLEGQELEQAIQVDIESIKNGSVSLLNDNVSDVLGSCIRSVIKAPEGKKLCGADLSNIEGRGLVWLSGEAWKLDYFRRFDNGEVPFDNYVMAYANMMNVKPETVDKYQRSIGKVAELGLGYAGGVSAFLTFANVYNLDLDELAEAVWLTGDQDRLQDCFRKHEWAKEHGYHAGLKARPYAACEYLKQLWRESHPRTAQFWKDLEHAFRMATTYDKETFKVGKLAFRRQGQWLYVRLPSGRCLTYLQPKIVNDTCTFVGIDQYTRKFRRIKTFGGKLSENVTSGAARDVMFHRMPDIEEAGYEIILRVHDELVAEVPDTDDYSGKDLARLMALPHAWSTGLPLAAEGDDMKIYHKT